MSPGKRKMSGGVDQRRRVRTPRRAVRDARVVRETRRVEEPGSASVRGRDVPMSSAGPPVGQMPVVGTFTARDLTAVIAGVLQHFQYQLAQPQQYQPLPRPPVVGIRGGGVQSGGVQSLGLPQPSVGIPDQSSGDRRYIICYRCGRRGHLVRTCRSDRSAMHRVAPHRVICFHCGQMGHMRRSCPQLHGQSQTGASGSQQVGISVTQLPQQQGWRPWVPPALPATVAPTSWTEFSVFRDRDQPGFDQQQDRATQ